MRTCALVVTLLALFGLISVHPADPGQAPPIKIGLVQTLTGTFDVYGKQVVTGFQLGLEHATASTMTVLGRGIELIVRDDEMNPERAGRLATRLWEDDKVALVVGATSEAASQSIAALTSSLGKILVIEPGVAHPLLRMRRPVLPLAGQAEPETGDHRYVFRTSWTMQQEAAASALTIGKPGAIVATLAQDYPAGRREMAAYRDALQSLGASVVHEEYEPANATDFTVPIGNIVRALTTRTGSRYLFVTWMGEHPPYPQLATAELDRHGIVLTTRASGLDALRRLNAAGLQEALGTVPYFHDLPKNSVNEWFVEQHQRRFGKPPDTFTAGGFAAAMAVVTAIRKAGSTDTGDLVRAFEGLEFSTPKGAMTLRADNHQALQAFYAIRLAARSGVPWLVPLLTREVSPEETAPPALRAARPSRSGVAPNTTN